MYVCCHMLLNMPCVEGWQYQLECQMQVGNALTDDFHDHLGLFQFMWSTGMISDQTFKKLNDLCDSQPFLQPSEQCNKVLDVADEEMGHIDPYSIFTPACTASFSVLNQFFKRRNVSL